eukprot:5732082-Pyramimonas_sp.AAC.1
MGATLETLMLDPDGEPLEDGGGHLLGQPRHLLFGQETGVAHDYRGVDGGVDLKHGCGGNGGDIVAFVAAQACLAHFRVLV